jgi:hypothetical protein
MDRLFKEIRKLVDDRQGSYGDGWKAEDLRDLYINIVKKARHLTFLVEAGNETDESAMEAILDCINYCIFSYYHLSRIRRPSIQIGLDSPTSWIGIVQPLADFDYVLVDKALRDTTYLDYFKKSSRPKVLNNRLIGTDTSIPLIILRQFGARLVELL